MTNIYTSIYYRRGKLASRWVLDSITAPANSCCGGMDSSSWLAVCESDIVRPFVLFPLPRNCHVLFPRQSSCGKFCTLQHSATLCNTLQHSVTLCSTLQHSATRCIHCNTWILVMPFTPRNCRVRLSRRSSCGMCNTLQRTAAHCNTLQHTATHCNTLQHTARTATHQLLIYSSSLEVVMCFVLGNVLVVFVSASLSLSHTHAHTHTHTFACTLSVSHSLSLSLSFSLSLSLARARARARAVSLTHTHCPERAGRALREA